jgi:hypothetical protein
MIIESITGGLGFSAAEYVLKWDTLKSRSPLV